MTELEALRDLLKASNALRNCPPVDDDFPEVMDRFVLANDRANKATRNPEDALATDIKYLAEKQWAWVERMKWHNKTVLEALALIASEVGEAVNECRGDKPTEQFGEELADIILRTLDLAETSGFDIGQEIIKKMAVNEARGTRGRKI